MPFSQRPFRRPSPVRVGGSVLAVGWRAYVARSGDGPARVTLTDDAGTSALASLVDGTEVEILAWRPRGAVGTRYRVRSTPNNLEGWLAAGNLRPARAPVSPRPAGPPPPAARAATTPGARRSNPTRNSSAG